jgi:16S rRNA (adenine1518-N6/adenine1519-N6)-dimethyltransferase
LSFAQIGLPKKYKLVANIPYYITGEILRLFLSGLNQPESITLLVQKEVAERIIAKNGKESILSLSVKVFGTPKITRLVRAGAFFPKPKVDSAVLCITNISRKNFTNKKQEKRFFALIKTAFNSKRKKISSTLKNLVFLPDNLKDLRPEDLTVQEWFNLSK